MTLEEQFEIKLKALENGTNEDLDLEDLTPEDKILVLAYRLQHEGDLFARLYRPSAERRQRAAAFKGVNRATVAGNPFQTIGSNLCFRGVAGEILD